jgi:uncharacterized membrane protein
MSDTPAAAPEKSPYQLSLEKSIAEAKARAASADERPRATLTLSDVAAAARAGSTWGTIFGIVIAATIAGCVALAVGGVLYWIG